ncbi:MAG: glycerophosphodiester phosphodiesterase [Acidobacteriota bacterium]
MPEISSPTTDPIVIAHRGASGYEPENTLRSFEMAIAQGAQMIELDLHETLDGHVVVIHDDDLSRTTDRPGRISKKTLGEVRKADAGKGERVPTLVETIELARGRVELYLEIKDPGAGAETVRTVREMGFQKDALLASFDLKLMRQLREQIDDIRLGLIVGVPTLNPFSLSRESIPWTLSRRLNFEVVSIETVLCQPMLVDRMRREGRKLFVWTANDERTFRKIVARDVDGIVTNYPDRLVKFLGSRKE